MFQIEKKRRAKTFLRRTIPTIVRRDRFETPKDISMIRQKKSTGPLWTDEFPDFNHALPNLLIPEKVCSNRTGKAPRNPISPAGLADGFELESTLPQHKSPGIHPSSPVPPHPPQTDLGGTDLTMRALDLKSSPPILLRISGVSSYRGFEGSGEAVVQRAGDGTGNLARQLGRVHGQSRLHGLLVLGSLGQQKNRRWKYGPDQA